jgi:hypothetical protein
VKEKFARKAVEHRRRSLRECSVDSKRSSACSYDFEESRERTVVPKVDK